MNLPSNKHDWAVWLYDQLENKRDHGKYIEGILPNRFDFDRIADQIPDSIKGAQDPRSRLIEFHPEIANVFETLDQLVKGGRRRAVPQKFTVRSLFYTHGLTSPIPACIKEYLDAVRLWNLLDSKADHGMGQNKSLFFIKTYDSKIEIECNFSSSDLRPLNKIDELATNYFESSHHEEEKRNIIRDALLETFKGKLTINLSELLANFSDFSERIRRAYTLYTSDFSFEKLRSEVDEKNTEDMLRLNKTVSEIQNQLLALPAALLLVGASVKSGNASVNISIALGVTAFLWIMLQLISNQRNSVESIKAEIDHRKNKIKEQPDNISSQLIPKFQNLQIRIGKQTKLLKSIRYLVWAVWAITLCVVINEQWPHLIKNLIILDHSKPNMCWTENRTIKNLAKEY